MCVYADHSNHSHYYTVQVVIELRYMVIAVNIVVEIDRLLFLVAHIYHHVLIRCMYTCLLNVLNLLLYSSVMSQYLCIMFVICTCMI